METIMLTTHVGPSETAPVLPAQASREELALFYQTVNRIAVTLLFTLKKDVDSSPALATKNVFILSPYWIALVMERYRKTDATERTLIEKKLQMHEIQGEKGMIQLQEWLKTVATESSAFLLPLSPLLKSEKVRLSWLTPFHRNYHSREIFYNEDESRVEVEMMSALGDGGFYQRRYDSKRRIDHKQLDSGRSCRLFRRSNQKILEIPFEGDCALLLIDSKDKKAKDKEEKTIPQPEERVSRIEKFFDNYEAIFSDSHAFFTATLPKIHLSQMRTLHCPVDQLDWLSAAAKEAEEDSLPHSDFPFAIDEEGEALEPEASPPPLSPDLFPANHSDVKFNRPFTALLIDREKKILLGISNITTMKGRLIMDAEEGKITTLFQRAMNRIALDFYKGFSETRAVKHRNFFFFTPTLVTALSMLYAGAPDHLQKLLEKALHMDELTGEKWHSSLNSWLKRIEQRSRGVDQAASASLKSEDDRFKFQRAQLVMHRANAPLTEKVRDKLQCYHAETISFVDSEEARAHANKRVFEVTEGIIPEAIRGLPQDTVLLLVTAALFQGQWERAFNTSANSVETFYNSDGSIVKVEMMNRMSASLYSAYDSKEDQYQMRILELPFRGGISLLLFIGESHYKLPGTHLQLEAYMTPEKIQGMLEHYDRRFFSKTYDIGVPKVTLKDRSEILQELNHLEWVRELLSSNLADSFIHSDQKVSPSELLSDTYFCMNEEGVKVAASTAMCMRPISCDPIIKIDHPFGLALIDKESKILLAMGQVLDMRGCVE